MRRSIILLFSLFAMVFSPQSHAQDIIVSQEGDNVGDKYHSILSKQLKNYKVVTIDEKALLRVLSDFTGVKRVSLKIDDEESWSLELLPQNNLVESMKVVTALDGDITDQINVYPYRGHVLNNPSITVSLTVAENFIYAYFQDDINNRFLEPLHHLVPGSPQKMYVVYDGDDVVFPEGDFCASSHMKKQTREVINNPREMVMTGGCFEVEYATASDFSMFLKYNNASGVTAHNIGVMNNVQTNYDDEFDDEILFFNVEQWISNCNTCDPWTTSTNASAFLGSFRSWGIGGGFSTPVTGFDFAQIWTNRNFNGSTIGVAYVGVICTGSKYQALQDFGSNANLLRVMTAHETGHNFNAVQSSSGHDPSGSSFIMAPSVSNVTAWSSQSIADIEAHYNSRTCLTSCSSLVPPEADFTSNVDIGCVPLLVLFLDESSNAPTSWNWTFPGGNPATSTEQNPLVTYSNTGNYDVTLMASNAAGNNTITKTSFILTQDVPFSSFVTTVDDNTVLFTNTSQNGFLYNWDFGDGEISTSENPIHIYNEDGSYIVNLTVTNDCGSSSVSSVIQIATLPAAAFSQSVTEGCAFLEVTFSNESSSNVDDFLWTFEGGEPSSSTEENPIVVYLTEGIYDVTLLVTNETGGNELFVDTLINVNDIPFPDFSSLVVGSTVDFTNNTMNADSYSWDFGDDSSSTDKNPSHTYGSDGDFTVSLTATNICGEETFSSLIVIATLPKASGVAEITEGCVDFVVQFMDSSSANVDTLLWTFEGGDPATSTEQNPIVHYENTGVFDVVLTVSNGAGEDTLTLEDYIVVGTIPIASIEYTITDDTIKFSSNASGADSYQWIIQGVQDTFDIPNPMVTFPADGIYIVELNVTNQCGTATFTSEVEILAFPNADFESNLVSGCSPLIVQFSDVSQDNVTSWSWEFEGGSPSISNEKNPLVEYDTAGVFQVTLRASNNIGDNVEIKENYIVVESSPIAGFGFSIDDSFVKFTNTSVGGNNYFWNFGDGETSEEVEPLHQFLESGAYVVMLIANDGVCADTTSLVITTIVNNVIDQKGFEFLIYPIPSHDYFAVEFSSNISGVVGYKVIDALGRNRKEGKMIVQKGNEIHKVDIDFSSGLYFLKLKHGGQTYIQKLVVE